MSAAKKYIQPYLHKVFVWTKESHTKSRQNNLHSVHTKPRRIYEQSGSQNKQHCTTHSNRWGKQKDTLMATYKAVMKMAQEYASSIWSHPRPAYLTTAATQQTFPQLLK